MSDDKSAARIAELNAALEGRYEIEREIGSGGMAVVYRARDVKHDRRVALKCLRPELASTLGAERFLREIQVSARLSHPHVLTLIDSGQAADTLFLAIPFVEGESLREWIDREGRLPLAETVRVASQIASALAYAHEEGLVHRDIKPENILIHRGQAQVSDFGIAVGVETAQSERLTSEGLSVGSPSYMSPEQAAGDQTVDGRSDVYSLACLTYEMIGGERPFAAESVRATIAKVMMGEARPLDQVQSDVPRDLAVVVARGMAREAAHRFQTAAEFAAALEACLEHTTPRRSSAVAWTTAAAAVVALVAFGLWTSARSERVAEVAASVAAIERAAADEDWISAYRGVMSLPAGTEDSTRDRLLDLAADFDTVTTEPAGARVSWRPLLEPDAPWIHLGETPLATHYPNDEVLLRLELDGHQTRHLWSTLADNAVTWLLTPEDSPGPEALWVPGGRVAPGVLAGGIWVSDPRTVGDYLIDRLEVSNEAYQAFVDAGGYERPELWEHDFELDGRPISWAEAMARFVDRTGRPGPSTWELGRFPDGRERHPVTGVSWYEAAAYARFVDRSLPTMYHWYRSAYVQGAQQVVPLSNVGGDGSRPVGSSPGTVYVGALDMAGNAREWVFNRAGEYRLSNGGGWNDPVHAFSLAQPLGPFDRSDQNGLRLITDLGEPELYAAAAEPVDYHERDFASETPVSDEIFEVFRSQFAYDPLPFNARVEATDTLEGFAVRERITFDATYDGPRMTLHFFRPVGAEGPLQTVVLFPGAGTLLRSTFEDFGSEATTARFTLRSGRAFAFPIYLSTFDREDDFEYALQDETNDYRVQVIRWYQDLARSLDYLETRPEVDTSRLAYYGVSLGGRMGGIMLALEPRFRAAVLNVAGLSPKPTQASVDPFNFLPRITLPVLMMSGQFDPVYPLDMSSRPFFERLGSETKQQFIAPSAHFVPWVDEADQTLRWLDRHLGPVR